METPKNPKKKHDRIPYYTGTRVCQVNRLYQHIPNHINNMLGQSVLCIYNNQLTDQPRQRNNTNRSYYHRQRTTNRYLTEDERNENQSDLEIKNQQQQQQANATTTKETQQENHAEIRKLLQQETTNTHQEQKNVTVRKAKITPTTQYHINREPPPKTTNYPEIQKTTRTTENKCSTSPLQKKCTIGQSNNTRKANSTRNTNPRSNTTVLPIHIDGHKNPKQNPEFYT